MKESSQENKKRRFIMKKQIIISMMSLGIIVAMAASAGAQKWAIKADYAESCSCNAACPCYFGSPATLGHCEAINLIEIKEGHSGAVRLDGISVVTALRLGKWVKFYVSENATDEQVKAARQLIETVFAGLFPRGTKVLSTERAPVSVKRTATKVKFSVPTSTVEIEMMKGWDEKPIKIQNLPVAWTMGHTQYKSITLRHHSEDKKFSYSGTNGFTSKVDVSGKK